MTRVRSAALLLGFSVAVAACDTEAPTASGGLAPADGPALSLSSSTDYANHAAVLGYAEVITDPTSGEAGRVIWLQKDVGNGQLDHDFVYGDPRRMSLNGGDPGVTYAVNEGFQSADAELEDQIGWLHDSVLVWDGEQCSDLTLSENAVTPGHPGWVAEFFAGNPLPPDPVADLTQVGFLPFPSNGLFSSPNVLGVTYTLFWVDENGNLTDIDGNGKIDVAFREIYYNDAFEWADNGTEGVVGGVRYFDFPSVAIHEVGHGFSGAHIGNIGLKNGELFVRPQAVMNAIYGGTLRHLTGRDRGLHCSNWAQWPNN